MKTASKKAHLKPFSEASFDWRVLPSESIFDPTLDIPYICKKDFGYFKRKYSTSKPFWKRMKGFCRWFKLCFLPFGFNTVSPFIFNFSVASRISNSFYFSSRKTPFQTRSEIRRNLKPFKWFRFICDRIWISLYFVLCVCLSTNKEYFFVKIARLYVIFIFIIFEWIKIFPFLSCIR